MGSARDERYSMPLIVELFDTERKVQRSEARRQAKNVGLALLAKYHKFFDSRPNRMRCPMIFHVAIKGVDNKT